MGSDSKKIYGAQGRFDGMSFDPEFLVISDDPQHRLYDKRIHIPLIEEMVQSIMIDGVVEPILVTKNGERDATPEDTKWGFSAGDRVPVVEVVDGRQRVKNAREANKRLAKLGKETIRIPALPKRGSDADLYGLSIVANIRAPEDSLLLQAEKLQRYIDMKGCTLEEACARLGFSISTGRNRLALLECSADTKRAIESGAIPGKLAPMLAKMEPEKQKATVQEMIEKGATKGAAAEKAVRDAKKGKAISGPKKERGESKALGRYNIESLYEHLTSEFVLDELKKDARTEYDIAYSLLGFILGYQKTMKGDVLGALSKFHRSEQKAKEK